jgi:hypothetical protein
MFSGSVNRLSSRSSPAASWFCLGLTLAGYDEVLSIEHEDLLLPPECHVAVNDGRGTELGVIRPQRSAGLR